MKNKGYEKIGRGGQKRCIMGDVQVAYKVFTVSFFVLSKLEPIVTAPQYFASTSYNLEDNKMFLKIWLYSGLTLRAEY